MYEELVGWLRSWSELPAHCECYESCEECNKQDICATFTNESIIAKAGEAANAIEELATFKEQITDGHFYCMRDGVLYEAKVGLAVLFLADRIAYAIRKRQQKRIKEEK